MVTIFLIILIALACVLLGFAILVQNPKGGGMGSSVGGFGSSFSSQFGVKQAANILEKATYVFIIAIALLSIVSVYVVSDNTKPISEIDEIINSAAPVQQAQPADLATPQPQEQQQQAPATTAPQGQTAPATTPQPMQLPAGQPQPK